MLDMEDLTQKQQAVFDFVTQHLDAGRPFPSLRQIGERFGISRNSAKAHIDALERKGYVIKRDERVSPFALTTSEMPSPNASFHLVAPIAAGSPYAADEESDERVSFDHHYFGDGQLKAVLVNGESMLGDAICEGDIAIIQLGSRVRPADVAAVRVAGEGITLKRVRHQGAQVELVPSNPDFPIRCFPTEDVEMIGKLVGVVRKA